MDTLKFYEKPINSSGYVYPCTLEEIEQQLQNYPRKDIEGLYAVGLGPRSRSERTLMGFYERGKRPLIELKAYPSTLCERLPRYCQIGKSQRHLAVAIRHGMLLERERGWLYCKWQYDQLKRHMLEFILSHEVAHHVFDTQIARKTCCTYTKEANESFADEYARRFCKFG